MKHKLFKTSIALLFQLLLVSCGNNQPEPEPEPEQPKNELAITCTKGPMTLNLEVSSEAEEGKVVDRDINLKYSKDKINWEDKTFPIHNSDKIKKIIWSIELNEGESVYLAGNNPNGFSFLDSEIGNVFLFFSDDAPLNSSTNENDIKFKVSGNIMSLINATDFDDIEIPPSSIATFSSLFYQSNVTDASELILSSHTLTAYCYESMFNDCVKLANAPVLPATTFNSQCIGCYDSMFRSCAKLTNVEVNFGEDDKWPQINDVTDFTRKWLDKTNLHGTFKWKGSKNPTAFSRNINTIPTNWIIEHID